MMVGAVRAFAAAANAQGVDGDAIARRHVAPELLNDPDGRVSFDVYRAVLADFVEEAGETIGLRAGALAVFGTTLEYLARTSPTLGGAFRHVQRYAKLTADRIVMDLHESADEVVLEFQIPVEVVPEVPTKIVRQSVEGLLALMLSLGRSITKAEWNPTEVRFSYARPRDTRELEEFFRAPLQFQAERSGLVLDPSFMKLAVVTADSQLNLILEACCATLMQTLPNTKDLNVEVIRRLTVAIPRGGHAIETIARDLGTSVRTLQRRLAEDGHSFQELLDETRHLLARRYLEESSIAIDDAALLLGYSEATAFKRAFKRWTGQTPADYRRAPPPR